MYRYMYIKCVYEDVDQEECVKSTIKIQIYMYLIIIGHFIIIIFYKLKKFGFILFFNCIFILFLNQNNNMV